MWSRLAFLSITLFWVTMNVLLWRSEYGGRERPGGAVPVEVVWRKMLTAPDHSSLVVLHHGKRAGECSWSAIAGRRDATAKYGDDMPSDGGPGFDGYRLSLEGQLTDTGSAKRWLFSANLALDANRAWQEFNARVNLGHNQVSVRSLAAEQSLHLRVADEDAKYEKEIRLADLGNPQALAQALELPLPPELAALEGIPGATGGKGALAPELNWEARVDWITVAGAPVRVYRLRAELFDRREIVVVVTTLGELLRVELPGEWVLASDRLGGR